MSLSLLPLATKLGQGNDFTRVCDFVHRGGSAPLHVGIHTHPPSPGTRGRHLPPELTPPRTRLPLKQTPQCSVCWEIQATSGQYTSYWNAILLFIKFLGTFSCFIRKLMFTLFTSALKVCFDVIWPSTRWWGWFYLVWVLGLDIMLVVRLILNFLLLDRHFT